MQHYILIQILIHLQKNPKGVRLDSAKHEVNHTIKEKLKIIFTNNYPVNIQHVSRIMLLTNSMAYGTRRYNAAFTRALQ